LMGAVVLIIIAMTICGVKYVSQSLQKTCAVLSTEAPDRNLIVVELAGDTDRRGIYVLTKDATVSDLLSDAGLRTDECCKEELMKVLQNGEKVAVERGQGHSSAIRYGLITASKRYVLDMAMNINSAEADDLELIPGLGKRSARDIVSMRKRIGGFRSIEELKKIPALRGKKYQEIKRHFFFEPSV